jgi:hypothetical protein
MGIKTIKTKECTCDICGDACGENDGVISIRVNGGDGRDVGPATINGKLTFTQPYGVSDGIICNTCKKKFLAKYIVSIDA